MERDHAAAFIGVTVGELAGVVIREGRDDSNNRGPFDPYATVDLAARARPVMAFLQRR